MLTQEEDGGEEKRSGEDLREKCYVELTKKVRGIYRQKMREKWRTVSVSLPDRKK
jgi:hypothetical protein